MLKMMTKSRTSRREHVRLERTRRALMWIPKLNRAVARVLRRYIREVAAELKTGAPIDNILAQTEGHLKQDLMQAQSKMLTRMAAEGYAGARAELELLKDAALDQERILRRNQLGAEVDKYLADTITVESATAAKRIGAYVRTGQEAGDTAVEIARGLDAWGLVESRNRANLIARTSTSWSYNEGAQAGYKDLGVKRKEWIASSDACPLICEPVNGEVVDLDQSFSVGVQHPPAHPNCMCTSAASIA